MTRQQYERARRHTEFRLPEYCDLTLRSRRVLRNWKLRKFLAQLAADKLTGEETIILT